MNKPLFRVYLNGAFLENEPIGLPKTELSITRDEDLKGVFFSFTSDLKFWGDGYAALRLYRDSCAQIPCNIEYRCAETGGYEVLFEGVVPIGSPDDVEWDDYNCIVTTKIENADFSNFLKLYGDNVLRVNTPNCIDDATALTPITTNLTELFGAFDGTLTGTGIKTYEFIPLLQQALSFLSNNQITLDEDPLYTKLFNPQILEYDFVDPLADGDIIEGTFTNYYGQEYTITHTVTMASLPGQIDIATFLAHLLYIADQNFPPLTINRNNYFEKASALDLSSGATTGNIINYLAWSAFTLEVNAGAKTANITVIQDFQYGLKNLAVTNSALIQQQDGSLTYTLNDLLLHTSQMHNMGFRMVKTTSGYDFVLRTTISMLQNTDTTVHLPQVNGITSKASRVYDAQGITTPHGITDNLFKPFTWQSNTCYADIIKVQGNKFSSQDFFDILNATQVQDNELYWLFLKEGDPTEAERYETTLSNDATPVPSIATAFHYNIPYMMALIAKAYDVNFADNNLTGQIPLNPLDIFSVCSNCPTARIFNHNTIFIRAIYKFVYPLSFAQVRTLIDESLQYITFSDGRTLSKRGFIKEVKIPFDSFIASFEVYAD